LDSVLFNFHDIVLIATIFLCALLAIILFDKRKGRGLGNIFLIAFFIASALVPIDTLINFGAAFRGWAIEHLPDWFYIFDVGFWLQGPLLLWYIRSIIYKNYRLRFVDTFYLLPFLLVIMHQLLAYHILPSDVKADIQREYNLGSETTIIFFITLSRELLRLYFGVLCVVEIRYYLSQISPDTILRYKTEIAWFNAGLVGLVGLWGWACAIAVALIVNVELHTGLPVNQMGLMANYGTLFLMAGFVVVLSRYGLSVTGIVPMFERSLVSPVVGGEQQGIESEEKLETVVNEVAAPPINPVYIERLEELIRVRKIYLEPSLTLEVLANEVAVSPRTLSTILNKHYGYNFFEYINTYRIEEAKKLLVSDEYQNATMLDIMYKVGFKSKATFNNFFKKMEAMTPREFKKNNAVKE